MDSRAVLALCHEHTAAEAEFDVDRVLATFVPVPRFAFYPMGMSVSGWSTIARFYRDQYPIFAAQVVGYQLLGEWASEQAAVQEYEIDIRSDGRATRYRVLSMMPVDSQAGLLTGERLYCAEGFVVALLGPLSDRLEPVPPD